MEPIKELVNNKERFL